MINTLHKHTVFLFIVITPPSNKSIYKNTSCLVELCQHYINNPVYHIARSRAFYSVLGDTMKVGAFTPPEAYGRKGDAGYVAALRDTLPACRMYHSGSPLAYSFNNSIA